VKNNVILHHLSTLKTFLLSFGNNAVEEYKIKYRARVPRSVHNMREPLDENVVRKILERALAVGPGTWKLFEGYALVSIALCTGLRPLELRQSLVSNIREDELGFIIHAKHVKGEDTWGKPRDVPVMWQGGEILRRYLTARTEKLKHLNRRSNALFPPLRGNDEFLSSNSLLVMKSLVEEDVGVKFELRTCRCTFGQLGLDEGHPLVNVSKALGHTSAVTTQKYYADKRQSVVVNEMRANSSKKLGDWGN
jgi:integrase/recombinase XerD